MKALILFGCVMLSLSASAQQFGNSFSIDLPDSATAASVEWVDLDNDGVLDVFAFATLASGEHFFVTYKTDTVRGLVDPAAYLTGYSSAVYRLADFDQDNDIDVIVSGISANHPRTSFFENQSEFRFAEQSSIDKAGSVVCFADVNSDGKGDLILSGTGDTGSFFNIFRFGETWKMAHDSLKIEASSIEAFDFDGDSDNDIFISGNENNVNVTKVLLNQGGFYFQTSEPSKVAKGKTSIGDLNHDGRLDVFLTGVNASGQNVSIQYLNQGQSFIAKDTLTPLSNSDVFLADFDSDGKCDIQSIGKGSSGDTLNSIALKNSIQVVLNKTKLNDQTFGDYDRDGDLDVLQVLTGPNSLQLQISKNELGPENKGPLPPVRAFGFTIFNKLFLYWEKSTDDHTPQNAITYDVTIHTPNAELIVGDFDLLSNRRLTVSHGNAGTRSYFFLKPTVVSSFNYTVQAVDNSFMSRDGGVCTGTGSPCQMQQIVEVPACKNETITFTAEVSAQWFSLSKGFLAEGTTYKMNVAAPDTIFSVAPDAGCSSLKIYLIKEKKNFLKKTTETRFVCEGQTIPFREESDWANILWKSQLRGNLGATSSIIYTVSQNDTITLLASNNIGCSVQKKTALRVSKPVVTLSGDVYQILKGEGVQLSASGGESYHWTPEESLDNSAIANPTASPLSSTSYIVTVSDSIGCTATASLQIVVEGTAFVPNLFTPNDDGKNDEVKVYGLATVSNFSFVIHNREGNVLYETKDVTQASGSGWDGTSKGVKQPAGVYYWKVLGQHPSGRKLLLNGKTNGSIVLIR